MRRFIFLFFGTLVILLSALFVIFTSKRGVEWVSSKPALAEFGIGAIYVAVISSVLAAIGAYLEKSGRT